MENRSIKAVVHGMVQGVSFRYYTRKTALSLGLKGWVKNQPDGTVSLVASGEPASLEKLAEWLRHGPDYARVIKVDLTWVSSGTDHRSFEILF